MNFEEKVEKSKEIIREAFERFDRIGVAWTTGKDSTVILHLVKGVFGEVPCPVIHGDTTVKFPEVYEFRDRLAKEWNLDLHIARPEIPSGFKIAGDRENCCHLLKTIPAQKMIEKLNLDAIIAGIRWDEQEARQNEKYFSKRKSHYRVHPILHWTEKDIWRYTRENDLPHNPLYDQGYRSIGCMPCTEKTPEGGAERAGRAQDKEEIMQKLRALGYW